MVDWAAAVPAAASSTASSAAATGLRKNMAGLLDVIAFISKVSRWPSADRPAAPRHRRRHSGCTRRQSRGEPETSPHARCGRHGGKCRPAAGPDRTAPVAAGNSRIGTSTLPVIWQICCSQGSRTSSSRGCARSGSCSHFASVGAEIVFIQMQSNDGHRARCVPGCHRCKPLHWCPPQHCMRLLATLRSSASKPKARRPPSVRQRLDVRFEQRQCVVGGFGNARDDLRLHDRGIADDRRQSPADLQLCGSSAAAPAASRT